MYTLANPVKDYPWGAADAIPHLLGLTPSGRPQAELWIGAHPAGPSIAITPEGERSLRDVIAADPATTLGSSVTRRFGAQLPFLLKVLSADRPLSLQVHPSKEQAERGYAAENAAGIPLDAPTRNYRDTNHKPELLLALTKFEALSGFKPPAASAVLLRQVRDRTDSTAVLDALIADLTSDSESKALRAATERLLTLDIAAAEDTVNGVVDACGGIDDPSARTAIELNREYGPDAGVVLSMLLNRISLVPGEAIFLPAGNLHAYLLGTGIEIMAASDNVLRGGLTGKHIDVPELLAVVDFTAGLPMRPQPVQVAQGRTDFEVPVDDFGLSVLDLDAGREFSWNEPLPRTAIVLQGDVELRGATGKIRLAQGESVFIAAADAPVAISGNGRLVAAFPGT